MWRWWYVVQHDTSLGLYILDKCRESRASARGTQRIFRQDEVSEQQMKSRQTLDVGGREESIGSSSPSRKCVSQSEQNTSSRGKLDLGVLWDPLKARHRLHRSLTIETQRMVLVNRTNEEVG